MSVARNMNIWIPYTTKGIGGPYTFVRLFSTYLRARGHTASFTQPRTYDALFVIAECSLLYALRAKLAGKPVIQRLDGIYYPALTGLKGTFWWFRNLRLMIIHRWLADHVIYQSNFCRSAAKQLLGKPHGKTSVVYNGVQVNHPELKEHKKTDAIRLIAFARFRRLDQIVPLLTAVEQLAIPYTFDIIGPHTPALASVFSPMTPHVRYLGSRSHTQIMQTLPDYDIMLFSDVSWCPNAVLEAQAAGVPVVAFQRGGAAELIKNFASGIAVPLADANPLFTPHQFTTKDAIRFAKAIEQVAREIKTYSQQAAQHVRERFVFNDIAAQYEDILTSYAQ